MEDAKGEGVRKQLPARRLNMTDGNISNCLQDKEEKQRKALVEEKKKQEHKEEKREKELQEQEEALKTLPPLVD
eukprot:12174820-Ditylum_brightwellii.AAC.1